MTTIGVLSVHLDGAPCAVGCPFCYLATRQPLRIGRAANDEVQSPPHDEATLLEAVERLDYAELAIALSEPVDRVLPTTQRLLHAARSRGRKTAITTTPQIVLADPSMLDGATRLNLSVDPWKISGDAHAILSVAAQAARAARGRVDEIVVIASLSTPSFAELLIDGLLEALVDLDVVDGVALNALKPPPPFCDRAFWLRTLSRLRPLLDRALDRRLHLDCYVAARLLGLGGCPGRADLSPSRDGKLAFRSCVYAARPDTEARVDELERSLVDYAPPAACPFDTRL